MPLTRLVFSLSRSTRPPRMNSDATVASTSVLSVSASHEENRQIVSDSSQERIWAAPSHGRMSATSSHAPTSTDRTVGMTKLRLMLAKDVLPQASRGPTAVRRTRNKPDGIVTMLKYGTRNDCL